MVFDYERFLASDLTQRITFEKKDVTKDENGNPIEEWVPAYTVWAEIMTVGGEEGRIAAAQSSLVRYQIRIRDYYFGKVDATMRIKWNNVLMYVTVVRKPYARANYMEVFAEEKQRSING